MNVCVSGSSSHFLDGCNSVVVSIEVHLSEALEWLLNSFALKCADFKKVESDGLGEGHAVLWSNLSSVLEVDFICNDHSS